MIDIVKMYWQGLPVSEVRFELDPGYFTTNKYASIMYQDKIVCDGYPEYYYFDHTKKHSQIEKR